MENLGGEEEEVMEARQSRGPVNDAEATVTPNTQQWERLGTTTTERVALILCDKAKELAWGMTPRRNLRLIRRVQATGTGWEGDGTRANSLPSQK